MPQIQIIGPSRNDLMMEEVGKSIGQGLGNFATSYMANKSLQSVLNDPSLKNASLSERQSKLQAALQPFGETGQQMLQTSMAIENQRQQEQAIQKLKGLDTAGKSPQEIIATYYEALQGHPRASEIISSALPYVLSKTAAEQTGGGLGLASAMMGAKPSTVQQPLQPPYKIGAEIPKGTPVKETPVSAPKPMPQPPAKKASAEQIDQYSNEYLNAIRPDLMGESPYGNVPTFDFQSKSDLRTEEEAQLRQNLTSKGILPQVQDQIVNRVREDIRTRYNELKDRYNISKDYQQMIDDKWASFRQLSDTRLAPYLGELTDVEGNPLRGQQEDIKNKYFQYASKQPVNLSTEAMHARSMALLQNDINRLEALKAIPAMPVIRQISDMKTYIDNAKEAAKPLIEEGMLESVKDDFRYNKDMGQEELHYAIWGDQTSKESLDKIHNVKKPILKTAIPYGPSSTPKPEQEKYVKNLSKVLKDIKPDDDLILLRSQVLANNGTERDFSDAVNMAMEQGLELSPFQKSQLQEIKIPRRRPIWEYFSSKGWNDLTNMIRGKQ